jgi:hypothetical protein
MQPERNGRDHKEQPVTTDRRAEKSSASPPASHRFEHTESPYRPSDTHDPVRGKVAFRPMLRFPASAGVASPRAQSKDVWPYAPLAR